MTDQTDQMDVLIADAGPMVPEPPREVLDGVSRSAIPASGREEKR